MKTITASFDGACEPYNPGGHMGLGWVIDEVSDHKYISAAYGNSNNVAEYMALLEVLKWAERQSAPASLDIYGDSELVIMQLVGEYAVRAMNIVPLYREAKGLLTTLKEAGWSVNLHWVPRERNSDADAASKLALIEHGIEPVRRNPDPGWTTRLGDIAEELGISAVALGKLMAQAGLRYGRDVTQDAVNRGIAQRRYNGYGVCIDWHEKNVIKLLRETQGDVLADAVNAHARKKARAAARREAEEIAAREASAEAARVAAYGPEVRRLVEAENCSLLDAIEWAVEDVRDRPAVYAHRRGWWRQRAVNGLSTNNPEHLAKIRQVEQTLESEYALLERRGCFCVTLGSGSLRGADRL